MTEVTKQDAAKERAWRTFLQNIWLDLCVFVGPLLYDLVSNAEGAGSKAYWVAGGLSLGKTAALVVISYVMRLKKTPKTETVR